LAGTGGVTLIIDASLRKESISRPWGCVKKLTFRSPGAGAGEWYILMREAAIMDYLTVVIFRWRSADTPLPINGF
jgi:hypothetical protein